MYLQYFGHSCVRIQNQSKEASILIDPFDPKFGWKLPRVEANILASTKDSEEYNFSGNIKKGDSPLFTIKNPGEYEVKKIFVYAVLVQQEDENKKKENITIFSVGVDSFFVGHLGGLKRPLTTDELDGLGRIDVLFVPVGGGSTLNAKQAIEVIGQIEPRIVIPIAYELKGMKTDFESIEKFLKEFGQPGQKEDGKVKMLKKDLPVEETKVIIITPS